MCCTGRRTVSVLLAIAFWAANASAQQPLNWQQVRDKFLAANPGTVMNVAADKPIEVLGNCYMMKRGEYDFKQMIDVAMEDLQNSGYIDQLLDKYEPSRNTFYRVALPYRIVK